MWILWKMWFWKCEFCEKWDFENVNFVKMNAYLSASLTGVLSLLQLLVALFVSFIVTPEGEGLGAQGAGNGPAAAQVFSVVGRPEIWTLSISTAQRACGFGWQLSFLTTGSNVGRERQAPAGGPWGGGRGPGMHCFGYPQQLRSLLKVGHRLFRPLNVGQIERFPAHTNAATATTRSWPDLNGFFKWLIHF